MSSGGVMLSGWLRKSPPESKLKSRHHSWKKRWFVLKSGRLSGEPNVLEYSKYQTSKKPIKIINLNDCKQIDVNVNIPVKGDKKDTSEHFVFSIVTSSRTFYLVTDSIREMSTWVQCLCDLCGFNHDANDKGDMGRHEQTFRSAQPTNVDANGPSSSTLLPSVVEVPPAPMPRPEKTSATTMVSRAVALSDVRNGTVNSCFSPPSHNGYDEEAIRLKTAMGITLQPNTRERDFFHDQADAILTQPDLPVLASVDDADSNGYLHLTECESVPNDQDSVFLSVDKADVRRCSTDSVFTHGDGTDDSKDDDVPLAPMIQPKSRFLDPSNARLDSMPSVPPPPPPTDVPPHPRFVEDDDDDDDDVIDARSKRTYSRGGRLPPIDDSAALYNVPPGLQRAYRFNNESGTWQGSNSSSSYGSGPGEDRYSGKLLSPPDYINTPDEKGRPSGSSFSSSGPSSANSINLGHQIYDVPSPKSPVFPLSLSASPRPSYQVPQSLERSIMARNAFAPTHSKVESFIKNELKGVKMLDVSQLPVSQNVVTCSSSQEHEIVASDLNTDSTYAVPPTRPPKPMSTPKGQLHAAEGIYSSPRNLNAAASDLGTYDIVKHQTPLSPPHSTVIGVIPNYPNALSTHGLFPHYTADRNAISATNSPLATPDLSRRNNTSKVTSVKSSSPLLIAQNKGVCGSAPSIYDVPQALNKSPAHLAMRETRSSCNSDGGVVRTNSARNSATDASGIYDMPRKSSDTFVLPKPELDRVDDMMHPSYEKMAARPSLNSDIQDDPNSYTAMAGVMSTPDIHSFTTQYPPALSKPMGDHPPFNIPPPVHRDLKPGRRSLGSDGGSSQSGLDRRNNNSRDSYESDEAVSPPHTSVHTIPVVSDQKSFVYGHNNVPVIGLRAESMTSPKRGKIGSVNFHTLANASTTPPQRPPKSLPLPRSPPSVVTSPSQPAERPYTPTHSSHTNPQTEQLSSPSPSFSAVPKRPPKPANMRYSHMSMHGNDESRPPSGRHHKSSDDHGFAPSRPPKPSMTPSTGDSLHSGSSLHSSFFPHSAQSFGPSSIVPPPPVEHVEREIKYIEISTPNPSQTGTSDSLQDRGATVEYTCLDADRTRALQKMKQERQNKMQQSKF